MSEPLQVCYERIPFNELYRSLTPVRRAGVRAIAVKKSMWPNGSTLRVSFLEGTPAQHTLVEQAAKQWTQHANLNFDFGDHPQSEIRIAFNPSDGAWSALGTDSLDTFDFPKDEATMNLGWVDEAVVLHEFGHAIGLGHEHQNPQGGILWNEPMILEALKGRPNYWPEEVTRHNVLRKYSFNQIAGTQFDPESIMLYFFPIEWTLNGIATKKNSKLSALDMAFIASQAAYPRTDKTQDECIVELPITRRKITHASIGQPGEEDLYSFYVKESRYFLLETRGRTNVFLRLYGPDSRTNLIDEDDDSGQGFNARIVRRLEPGEYLVQIRHSDFAKGTGEYGIRLRAL
jgi:hypothetical protein